MYCDLNEYESLSSQQLDTFTKQNGLQAYECSSTNDSGCRKIAGMADSSCTIESYETQSRQYKRIRKQKVVINQEHVIKKKCPELNQFTATEDKKILELVREYGTRFCVISKLFPDKSIYAIKNRYYKVLKYKWRRILKWHPQGSLKQRKNKEVGQLASLETSATELGLFNETKGILFNFLHQLEDMFK